jgi:hypothetical protein
MERAVTKRMMFSPVGVVLDVLARVALSLMEAYNLHDTCVRDCAGSCPLWRIEGAAPAVADRSIVAPGMPPHNRTLPLLMRYATVASVSSSFVVTSLTVSTKSTSLV